MRNAVAFTALALLSACTSPLDLGFALAIDLTIDNSVPDADVARIAEYEFRGSGDETYDAVRMITHKPTRHESVVYRPSSTTTSLELSIMAEDEAGTAIADGMSPLIKLTPGATLPIEVVLSRIGSDAGVDVDAGDASSEDGGNAHALVLAGCATYATSNATTVGIAVGDFNEDGAADVASINFVGGEVDLRPGETNHSLGPLFTTTSSVNLPLFAIGDFNSDGHLDAAGGDVSTMTQLHFWDGNGKGQLTSAATASPKADLDVLSMLAANFDKQAGTDLALMGANGTEVIYNGDMTTTTDITAANPQTAMAIGDVNGDGFPDIVTLIPSTYSVQISINEQAGANHKFGTTTTVVMQPAMNNPLVGVAVGDLDGDGRADIAVSTSANEMDFCAGSATPPFCTVLTPSGVLTPDQLKLVDFDGDGHADLVMTHSDAKHVQGIGVTLYKATGPTFGPETLYPTGLTPDSFSLGDIDGDTHIDIAVANKGSQSVSVVFNTTAVDTPLGIWGTGASVQVGRPIVADVNADGRPDVLLPEVGGTNIDVLLGKGDGTFTSGTRLGVTTGDVVGSAAVADIDGDAKNDLIVVGNGSVDVFLGNGSAFNGPVRTALSTTAVSTGLATGDLDHDGKLDVAFVVSGDTSAYALFGTGTAHFPGTPVSLPVDMMFESTSIAIGKLDGDAYPDVIASSAGHDGAVVFLHKTATTFGSAQVLSSLLTGASVVRLADLDADGKLDLLIAGAGGFFTAPGLGTGQFGTAQKRISATRVDDVLAVGLTTSGALDLLAVSATTNQLLAWPNVGGVIGTQQSYTVGALPNGLATGDFDGDGKPDVIAGSLQTGVSRVRNISP